MTHHYTAETIWERAEQPFTDNRYSRQHRLRFDGGIDVPGSSSPHVIPLPFSIEAAVDPEEAFISALSSCHMLWFLSIAAKRGYRVDHYHDQAFGIMEKNAASKLAITRVTLRPSVQFSGGKLPTSEAISEMHHEAHEECYIANSVKTQIVIEPRKPENI